MREESLRELTRALQEMSLLIRHRALPVRDLFTELSRYEFFSKISEFGDLDFREEWVEVTDTLTELTESERKIIKSIGLSLGTSDVEGQLSMLEVNAQLLTKHGDEAHEQYLKKGRLYRSIGVLAGLFVAILII
jgi:stage III sporulation protein AB